MSGSELALQSALARVLTDSAVRHKVFRSEGDVPGCLGLTEEQFHLMRGIDQERVELFAELLILNRVAKAMDGLPMTTRLLGPGIWSVAQEFCRACPATDAKKYLEALAFGEFVEDKWRRGPSPQPYALDALCYEMNFLEVRFGRGEPTPTGLIELASFPEDGWQEVVPFMVTPCRVVAMNYDLEALRPMILNGGPLPQSAERPMLLVIGRGGCGEVLEHEISMSTLVFLQGCDGISPLGQIVDRLASEAVDREVNAFAAECVALCRGLVASGMLRLGRRDPLADL